LSSSGISNSPYLGYWYAPAYGYVLSVDDQGDVFLINTYSLTTDYCLLQKVESGMSQNEIQKKYTYRNEARDELLKNNGAYPPAVIFEKLDQLPVVCQQNLMHVKSDTAYSFNARNDFEIFWQTMNELYINFELRGVDWNKVYKDASQSLDDMKSEEELFGFLAALIEPLGDPHAVLINAPLSQQLDESITAALKNEQTPIFSASRKKTLSQKLFEEYVSTLNLDDDLNEEQLQSAENYIVDGVETMREIILDYADENADIETSAADEIAWFKTPDNIGYLFIGSMADYTENKSTLISDIASDLAIAEVSINQALQDLENTKGLIIDVRFNDGGQDQIALNFVRHFMSQSQVIYAKSAGRGASATPLKEVLLDPQSDNIYVKPTAVLVSGDTVSAAELFTLAMASLPQVTIIGEPTAGAFSDILVKRLTSDIVFGVSNETYFDTQGNNYEEVGIPPDITVPFATLQERQDGYDAGIDKAIEWIKTAP
jgi:carboxyl-terminal processing protease